MVKDATEARNLTTAAQKKLALEADVQFVLQKVKDAANGGVSCVRIYKLLSIGQQLKLTYLGFTVKPDDYDTDAIPSYTVSWFEQLPLCQKVLLNG